MEMKGRDKNNKENNTIFGIVCGFWEKHRLCILLSANTSKAAAATAMALVSINVVPGDGDLVANDDEGMLP